VRENLTHGSGGGVRKHVAYLRWCAARLPHHRFGCPDQWHHLVSSSTTTGRAQRTGRGRVIGACGGAEEVAKARLHILGVGLAEVSIGVRSGGESVGGDPGVDKDASLDGGRECFR